MRIGGPLFTKFKNPKEWIAALALKGYRASYCPVNEEDAASLIEEYRIAALEHDIVIAEVGAWGNNMVHPDEAKRESDNRKTIKKMELAERVGALCCVNSSGSRGLQWNGAHSDNLTPETFKLIVKGIKRILGEVDPVRTFFTLEMMPHAYPTGADEYLELIRAVDHPRFGVHLDIANIINSMERYEDTAAVIDECFDKLAPFIRSVHLKDVELVQEEPFSVREVMPGQGRLDYPKMLKRIEKASPDMCVMMEHLVLESDYDAAYGFIKGLVDQLGLTQ